MKVLGLIPARGGSKGIPGKNIRPIAGRSLVEWTFRGARAAGVLDRIILSTDDDALLAEAARIGLEAPFRRPADIAGDATPMLDVVLHALRALGEAGYHPDAVLLLQPTSPLRSPETIRAAVGLLDGVDAVCSVIPVPEEYLPHRMMVLRDGFLDYAVPDGARYTRRQDAPPAYKRDGNIFLTRAGVLLGGGGFYGARCRPLVSDPAELCNIDTPAQWDEAERRLRARHGNP